MNELLTEHSEPVDMTAVRVVKFKGERYAPAGRVVCAHSETPMPTRLVPTWSGIPDLTGVRFGRMTVIGLGLKKTPGKEKPAKWVVRCDCGHYETRSSRSVRNPCNGEDMCHVCRQIAFEKHRCEFKHLYTKKAP